MVTLRSVLYLLFMVLSVILYSVPISIFGWIFPFSLISRAGQHWGLVNLRALEIICGLTYRVEGLDNVPSSACIVLCKHQSAWETIALRALLPGKTTWVVKRELLWIPFFGWALAVYRPIAIDRTSRVGSIRKLLSQGKYWLDKGRLIVIFPEGTRVGSGERGHYGQGGSMLAQRTKYPVIPIAHNAGVFWRRREIKKHAGRIDLVIGKPLEPDGLSASEITQRIEAWIEGTVAGLPSERTEAS
jgi:1-acyl-sn-glycerol-3-phosphate acyltransferase